MRAQRTSLQRPEKPGEEVEIHGSTDRDDTAPRGDRNTAGGDHRKLAISERTYYRFTRPGKPTDNPFIEAFDGSLGRERLSQHWFVDLDDAQRTLQSWKDVYNNVRPHSSLANQVPAHFGAGGHVTPVRNRVEFSPS